jgi:ferredoxin-NADP reductase
MRRDHGYHPLTVKRIVDETPDARSLVFAVPDELRDAFGYRPGQFCTFRLPIDGDDVLRSYSMSSAPGVDDDLTVTVKRVPGGRGSNWLHDHVGVGDTLDATLPAGVFCVGDDGGPVVAFAAGSGVTPIMSIAKAVLAGGERPIRVLYANRDQPSVIFHDELERLGAEHGERLHVQHHLDVESGFLEADTIGSFVTDQRDAEFLICGPTPFMDLVDHTLTDLGVDPGRIAIERFVNAHEPPPPVVDRPAIDQATDVPETVTLILKGKRHDVAYRAGDTLLDTARRGGLAAPFSCEAGNCATCMALMVEGSATMRANNALTPDEVAEGWVLTCQAIPSDPTVTVEYEDM